MANDLQLIILKHFRKELATVISIQLEDSSKVAVSNSVTILENFLNKRILKDDKKSNYFAFEIDSKESDVFLLKTLKVMRLNGWVVLSSHVLESLALNSLVNNIETTFYLEKIIISANTPDDSNKAIMDPATPSNHGSSLGISFETVNTNSAHQRRASISRPTDSHPLDGHSPAVPYRTSVAASSTDDSKSSSVSANATSNLGASSVTSGKLYQKFLTRRASLKSTASEASPSIGGSSEIQLNKVEATAHVPSSAFPSSSSAHVKAPPHFTSPLTPSVESSSSKPRHASDTSHHPLIPTASPHLLGDRDASIRDDAQSGSNGRSSIPVVAKATVAPAKQAASSSQLHTPSTAEALSSYHSGSITTPAPSAAVTTPSAAFTTPIAAPESTSKVAPGSASGVRTAIAASAVDVPCGAADSSRSQDVPDVGDIDMVKSSINPLSSLSKTRKQPIMAAPIQQTDQHEIEKINHFSKLGSAFFGGNSLRRGTTGRGAMQREPISQAVSNHGHHG